MDDLRGEIDRIEKRTRRYWFDDGIVEISAGIVFLLVGVYFLIEQRLGGAGAAPRVMNVIFAALVVVLAFSARWAARRVKDRFVHPRTGFIAYPRRQRHTWARGALGAVLGFLLAFAAMGAPLLTNWIPALLGGVFAAAFLYAGLSVNLLRFPVEGLLSAIAGVVVSLLRVSEDVGVAMLFGALGVVITCGGFMALAAYVRRTAPPEEA